MSTYKVFEPRSDTPPAKVKDIGISRLVMDGAGAFNAKSGELLLLPIGESARLEASSELRADLLEHAGAQTVNCGSDEAVRSLAERYIRNWGDAALTYIDTRGRDLRMLAWRGDEASICRSFEEIERAIDKAAAKMSARCVEDTTVGALRSLKLLSISDGASDAADCAVCPSCGRILLPSSPYDVPSSADADEIEEEMRDVETPGADTIASLCEQLGIDIKKTVKAMLLAASDTNGDTRVIEAYVRGDMTFSMEKLAAWAYREHGLSGLRHAEKFEIEKELGDVAGYCGPVGLPDSAIAVCDKGVEGLKNIVAGANRHGYHKTGCCWGRDFVCPVADIMQIVDGIACDKCGSTLEPARARIIGSVIARMAREDENVLSYKDREGAHSFPAIIEGTISTDGLILSGYEHRS